MVRLLAASCVLSSLASATPPKQLPNCDDQFRIGKDDHHVLCYPDDGIGMCTGENPEDPPRIDNEAAVSRCSDACGEKYIPFTMGVFERGVGKDFANKLCFGEGLEDDLKVISRNDELFGQCARRWNDLKTLHAALGEFVAKFEDIATRQAEFREDVRNSIKEMEEEIAEGMETKVKNAFWTEKTDVAHQVVKDALEKVGPEKGAQTSILIAIRKMLEEGGRLSESVHAQLDGIKSFNDDCLKLINVPMGEQKAHMMDICAPEDNYCMAEEKSSRHIACCCGGMATQAEGLDPTTPGIGMEEDCKAKAVGRRLLTDSGPGADRRLSSSSVADACRFATLAFLDDAFEAHANMTAKGQDTSELEELIERHRDMYNCESPVDFGQSPRRLKSSSDGAEVAWNPSNISTFEWLKREARKLTATTCLPPREPVHPEWKDQDKTPLHVTEAQHPEAGFCSDGDLGLPKMQEMCEDFCGDKAIPLLLGTPSIGFDHAGMDQICMAPGGKLMTPTVVKECHKLSGTLQLHKDIASDLVASLLSVITEMDRIRSLTKTSQKDIHDWITDTSELGATYLYKMANHGDEGDELLLRAFRDKVKDLKDADSEDMQKVEVAIELLEINLKKFDDDLPIFLETATKFMDECQGLAVGWDSHDNYLMDVCKVNGDKCLAQDDASRAGCCCAYMPLQTFGEVVNERNAPIHGLNEPGSDRRLGFSNDEHEGRRLSSLDPICQSALLDVARVEEETWARLKEAGHENIITDRQNEAAHAYPVCSLHPPTTPTTTTTTTPSLVTDDPMKGLQTSTIQTSTINALNNPSDMASTNYPQLFIALGGAVYAAGL